MSEDLGLVGTRAGLSVRQCLAKLRFFCEHDAYRDYDRVGYQFAGSPNEIQAELLTATNRAMRARSPRKAWEPLLDRTLPALAQLPLDGDLIASTDDEYTVLRAGLERCYRSLTAVKWITDMAASKMLYLKRPRLVAISDSYVRDVLAVPEPDSRRHPWRLEYCTERALRVSDAVRAVGRHNAGLLGHLQEAMADTVQSISDHHRTRMSLSKARIVDILLWVDAAIAEGHKLWRPAAEEAGWGSVVVEIERA